MSDGQFVLGTTQRAREQLERCTEWLDSGVSMDEVERREILRELGRLSVLATEAYLNLWEGAMK